MAEQDTDLCSFLYLPCCLLRIAYWRDSAPWLVLCALLLKGTYPSGEDKQM